MCSDPPKPDRRPARRQSWAPEHLGTSTTQPEDGAWSDFPATPRSWPRRAEQLQRPVSRPARRNLDGDKERLDRTEKLSSRCRVRMPTGRFRYALPGGRIAETVPLLRNFVPKRLRDNLPWKGQRAELSPIRATQAFFAACLPRNRSILIYVAAASNPTTTARKVKSQPL